MADMNLGQFVDLGTAKESPIAPISEGIQTGMKLAQTQQQMEVQKQQVETQKAELEEKKWTSAKGMLNTYLRAAPAIQKAMEKQVTQRWTNLGGDPAIIQAAKDQDTGNLWRQAMLADNKDPVSAAVGMQSIAQLDAFNSGAEDKAFQLSSQRSKLIESENIAKAKAATAVDVANINAKGRVDAAQARIAATNVKTGLQAGNQYYKNMNSTESGLATATKADKIITDIDEGTLQSNKTIRADLTGALATLVNNGRPSTVYGQSHQEFDSAYTRAQDALNFLKGKANSTMPEDQFTQLKADIHALQGMYGEQHENIYQGFRAGLDPSLQPLMDARFNAVRKRYKLNPLDTSQGQQTPAGGAPTAPQTPSTQSSPPTTMAPDTALKDIIKKARDVKIPDADIRAKLLMKGHKPADIDKALGGK